MIHIEFGKTLSRAQKNHEQWIGEGKTPLVVLVPGISSRAENPPFKSMKTVLNGMGLHVLEFHLPDSKEHVRSVAEKADYVVDNLAESLEENPDLDRGRVVLVGHSQGGAVLQQGLDRIREIARKPLIVTLSSVPNLGLSKEMLRATRRELYPNTKEESVEKGIKKILEGLKDEEDVLAAYPADRQIHFIHAADKALPPMPKELPSSWQVIETAVNPETKTEKIRVHNWEDHEAYAKMWTLLENWLIPRLLPKPA